MSPVPSPHTPVVRTSTSVSAPLSNRATTASKLHSWQKMTMDVQPSCLLANPEAANSPHHLHTDECWRHLRGPLNNSNTTTTSCSAAAASTTIMDTPAAPPNTERIMANAAAKLSKENCKKLGESLELYQKLTVSTQISSI